MNGLITEKNKLRIGIDIGGTFTDFVIYDADWKAIYSYKIPSTPDDPSKAVLLGLKEGLGKLGYATTPIEPQIIHGSTIATNALLERKGAITALITTAGFKDIIQIGRQNRPNLYDFKFEVPSALIPSDLRMEVKERIGPDGSVIETLDDGELEDLITYIYTQDIESVAVCLLFSFTNPSHEEKIKAMLLKGFKNNDTSSPLFVSVSHEVLSEFREYERTSTTVVNAYVSPILGSYLTQLEEMLPVIFNTDSPGDLKLRVMQSNGGSISIQEGQRLGVYCILSGPAGGVIGSHFIADMILEETETDKTNSPETPQKKIITFDMGGTSTDVALIDGEPTITKETIISGCPIGIPVLDIHTIGSGGGSIARVDPGGALRVGPESAGAEPGPACYGTGDFPTVTDANLILGRMAEEYFLGGRKAISKNRSLQSLSKLGREMGLNPYQAALGVIEIAN
ncbi:MAG: hydantoinase/oxoprolinase family protein, partial [Anaerolineales bacterium]